jgi:Ras-related protein Rab-7A
LTNQKSFDSLSRWKQGFLENAGPNDPQTYPFVVIGNKLDKEGLRQVSSEDARRWCKENGDIPYFETSALENIAVDTAFIEMAKSALKRESQNQLFSLPDTIGGAGGAIKLNQFAASNGDKGAASGGKKKKKGCC